MHTALTTHIVVEKERPTRYISLCNVFSEDFCSSRMLVGSNWTWSIGWTIHSSDTMDNLTLYGSSMCAIFCVFIAIFPNERAKLWMLIIKDTWIQMFILKLRERGNRDSYQKSRTIDYKTLFTMISHCKFYKIRNHIQHYRLCLFCLCLFNEPGCVAS